MAVNGNPSGGSSKVELPHGLAIPLVVMHQKEMQSVCCTLMFTSEAFISGRMDKNNVVHIHNRILFNHKKKEILSLGTM
jgi:hypothetical protein